MRSVSTFGKLTRLRLRLAACRALVAGGAAILAAPAFASTVSLSSADAGGGLNLNAANVLIASGPYGGSAYTGSDNVVQGVTFLRNTTGTVTTTVGSSSYNISFSETGGTALSHLTGSFDYSTNSTPTANTVHDTQAPTQPDDTNSNNLQTILDTVDYSTAPDDAVVEIGGLTPGQAYEVDLLQSVLIYATRTDTIIFNDGTTETVYLQDDSTSHHAFAYDSNDTVTANSSGDITANISSSNVAVINGVVVSTVPEPASLGLLSLGAFTLLIRRRCAR